MLALVDVTKAMVPRTVYASREARGARQSRGLSSGQGPEVAARSSGQASRVGSAHGEKVGSHRVGAVQRLVSLRLSNPAEDH